MILQCVCVYTFIYIYIYNYDYNFVMMLLCDILVGEFPMYVMLSMVVEVVQV